METIGIVFIGPKSSNIRALGPMPKSQPLLPYVLAESSSREVKLVEADQLMKMLLDFYVCMVMVSYEVYSRIVPGFCRKAEQSVCLWAP